MTENQIIALENITRKLKLLVSAKDNIIRFMDNIENSERVVFDSEFINVACINGQDKKNLNIKGQAYSIPNYIDILTGMDMKEILLQKLRKSLREVNISMENYTLEMLNKELKKARNDNVKKD